MAKPHVDRVALTMRMPKGMKRALENLAETKGETMTALLRQGLDGLVHGTSGRLMALPGFVPQFNTFIEENAGRIVLLLVESSFKTNGASGTLRLVYAGIVDTARTNGSIVTLNLQCRSDAEPYGTKVVLRAEIAAFFAGRSDNDRLEFTRALIANHWQPEDGLLRATQTIR